MSYPKIVRAITCLVLLSCSTLALAETCPPAGTKPDSRWSVLFGDIHSVPFQGAVYGIYNQFAMTCNYFTSSLPDGYVLISNFNVQQPNTNTDRNWQYVAGHVSCISKNIETCQFTAQP